LNIVADAKPNLWRQLVLPLTYSVTGLANGDEQHNYWSIDLEQRRGKYRNLCYQTGTLAATGNYDIAYTGADFNITKATLNIVADAKSKDYGTEDPALTYSINRTGKRKHE